MKAFLKICGKILSVCVFIATLLHLIILLDIIREERAAERSQDFLDEDATAWD